MAPDGERTFVQDRAAALQLGPADLKPAWFARADAVHMPIYSLLDEPLGLAGRRAIELGRASGAAISLDQLSGGRFILGLGPSGPQVVEGWHGVPYGKPVTRTREYVSVGSGRLPVLGGRYNVPHYDAKGEANAEFVDRGVPTTLLYTSFFWDNLVHFGMQPQRGEDGRLAFVLPMGNAKLPGIASGDVGPCALGIFGRGDDLVGKSVGIAGEQYFEVLDGLKAGDQVITGPFSSVRELSDGQSVKIQQSTRRTNP